MLFEDQDQPCQPRYWMCLRDCFRYSQRACACDIGPTILYTCWICIQYWICIKLLVFPQNSTTALNAWPFIQPDLSVWFPFFLGGGSFLPIIYNDDDNIIFFKGPLPPFPPSPPPRPPPGPPGTCDPVKRPPAPSQAPGGPPLGQK